MLRRGVLALIIVTALSACGDSAGEEKLDTSRAPGCYDAPNLDANVTVLTPTEAPRAACEQAWRRGEVVRGDRTPPALVTCVGNKGTPWVFPAEGELCESLDLAVAAQD